jgi:hypothetical protein
MFQKLMPMLLALTALPVGATTQFYYTGGDASHNEAAFDTATGLLTDYAFTGETLTAPNSFSLLDAGPTGVDFYGFWDNNITPYALSIVGSTLRATASNGGATGSTIRVDLPTDVRAIGLHVTGTGGAQLFCFEAPGTTTCDTTLVFGVGDNFFFGIISDSAISPLQIRQKTDVNSLLVVQNFEVGMGASEAPEPSTMVLVGSGLILFPLLARRKRRS